MFLGAVNRQQVTKPDGVGIGALWSLSTELSTNWSLGLLGLWKSPDAFFWDQERSGRGADHLIEQRMEVIERPMKAFSIEIAAPNFQSNALVGFPCMYIVSIRTGKALNPESCLSQVVNGLRLLTGQGVERNGHGNRFDDTNQFPSSVKDLRPYRIGQKKSKCAVNWLHAGPGAPVLEAQRETPPQWQVRPRG